MPETYEQEQTRLAAAAAQASRRAAAGLQAIRRGTTGHTCDSGHFDRTLCAEPCGAMHSYCATCGERQDPCAHD